MINANNAREITEKAKEEQRAYTREMIEREVEDACEDIRCAADRGIYTCDVSARNYNYPKEVSKYLIDELGYTAEYESSNHIIVVSW